MSSAMAERIPSIVLTDPQNHRAAAPQSPARDIHLLPPAAEHGLGWAGAVRSPRPETPKHARKGSVGRGAETGSNSPNWASPGRLIRSLSNNAMATSNNQSSSSRERQTSSNGNGAAKDEAMAAMDPLSQHIMNRTSGFQQYGPPLGGPVTENNTANRERRESDQSEAASLQDMPPPSRQDTQEHAHRDLKKGVKAVSFLSRLMHGSKKKDADEETLDDESTSNDGRPEGNDAKVFAETVDNMGFNPRHPQPPGYIKVRSKHKKQRDFDRLFLAQELDCRQPRLGLNRTNSSSTTNKLRRKSSAVPSDGDTVWAMEFSKDGRHLAAAGADMILRIWAVLASPEDRQKHQRQEMIDSDGQHLSAPVFQQSPIREYEGHTATILDVSWSKNNFILSSSMDKTVRLWHTSRSECLCTFKHTDFVPSIAFHPKDDRFFLTGSLDNKLRLWSIPDKNVAFSAKLPDMITAVGFTPDGKYAMAGCLSGLVVFHETEGLKYQTQIHVRSTRGQNVKGSKITGIQSHIAASGEIKILITSNDSRIRLYNFRDKSLELKFKGNANACSQIRATLSEDARYVVCGSEDRKAYIWSLGPAEGEKRDKRPVEMFEAHNTITTAVCFAPAKTRQLLSRSEDPVYDLCNPPPITLVSRSERASSQSSSKPPTDSGSIQTPADPDARFEKPKEPASYVTRSHHKNGNIIVTADYTGRIKVFRQDCAWPKRRQEDDRSSLFGKRSTGGGSKLSRNNSVATRTSQRSLREQSLREPRTSTSSQPPSDRILSWRQNVSSTPSIAGSNRSASKQTNRSTSPRRSVDSRRPKTKSAVEPLTVLTDSADSVNRTPRSSAPDLASTNSKTESPSRTRGDSQTSGSRPSADAATAATGNDSATPPSSRSSQNKNENNPLNLEGDRSYIFWDTSQWKERIEKMKTQHKPEDHPSSHTRHALSPVRSAGDGESGEEGKLSVGGHDNNHLAPRPSIGSAPSFVSKLSDERSSSMTDSENESDDEVYDDAPER